MSEVSDSATSPDGKASEAVLSGPSVAVQADRTASLMATIVDELARNGVRDAVICPGKRSTLGAVALDRHPNVHTQVVLDERVAGYVALGKALATRTPVVIWTTSGTAVTELHPAVSEASVAEVPLLVMSADRPLAQHHVRDWQTLDVANVFGDSTRWSWSFGGEASLPLDRVRSVVSRAVLIARGVSADADSGEGTGGAGFSMSGRPGPVHLNLPIAEPVDLMPTAAVAAPGRTSRSVLGRSGRQPWHRVVHGSFEVLGPIPEKTLVIAGAEASPELLRYAGSCDIPVVADVRSPVRVRHAAVIALGALACADLPIELIPDLVITTGRPPVAAAVQQLVRSAERVWHVGERVRWEGTADVVDTFLLIEERTESNASHEGWCFLPRLRGTEHQPSLGTAWFRAWRERDDEARRQVSAICGGPEAIWSEPTVAHRLFRGLAPGGRLVCGTSSPVRDVDAYALPRDDVEVFANRGVSGLEGLVATAVGIATSQSTTGDTTTGGTSSRPSSIEVPTVLLLGDLGFLYDAMAMVTATNDAREISLTVVVVDNQGGGIFRSFGGFEVSLGEEAFERLVATPQNVDLAALTAGMGVPVTSVDSVQGFDAALLAGQESGVLNVVIARVDGKASHAMRKQLALRLR